MVACKFIYATTLTGTEITLLAKFGATQTIMPMDLGFGDRVEPIEYPIDLTTTLKGPLFENKISLHCYPKEFIFAEKLETVIFRGAGNTRMKDFHDLYSLIRLEVLNDSLAKKAILLVFHHRKTPLKKLPITFDRDAFKTLEQNWSAYHRKLTVKSSSMTPPKSIEEVVLKINHWLEKKLEAS